MSTPAATSGPASEPRPASSAPATNRAPSARSKRKSSAGRFRRGSAQPPGSPRKDRNFSRGLEEPDPVGRPVGEEGLADDPAAWDRSPEAAVVTLDAVVAHHEVVVGRDRD